MSSSITSTDEPSVIEVQCSQSLQGVAVGPCSQLSALARIRAVEVLPVPRGPGEQVRVVEAVLSIAWTSVWITCCCPTTSSKVCGRYLRYSETYATGPPSTPHGSAGPDTLGGRGPRCDAAPILRTADARPRSRRGEVTARLGRPRRAPLGPDPVHRGTSPTDARHRGRRAWIGEGSDPRRRAGALGPTGAGRRGPGGTRLGTRPRTA
jgi:hypothetical protein